MLENNLKIKLSFETKILNTAWNLLNVEHIKEAESDLIFQLNTFFTCDSFSFFSMNNFIDSLEIYYRSTKKSDFFVLLSKEVIFFKI